MNNIIVVSTGICIDSRTVPSKYLLSLRGPEANGYPNLWEFPGGAVKPFESTQEAVIRELKEEISVDVSDEHVQQFSTMEIINPDISQHIILMSFICNLSTKFDEIEIGEPGKCSELKWVSVRDLVSMPENQFTPGTYQLIQQLFPFECEPIIVKNSFCI